MSEKVCRASIISLASLLAAFSCGCWWSSDECLGESDDGSVLELSVGERLCLDPGVSGGIEGIIHEVKLEGDVLRLIDSHEEDDGANVRDGFDTTFYRYEVAAAGEGLLSVLSNEDPNPACDELQASCPEEERDTERCQQLQEECLGLMPDFSITVIGL